MVDPITDLPEPIQLGMKLVRKRLRVNEFVDDLLERFVAHLHIASKQRDFTRVFSDQMRV